jgi:hypothetical protein
MSDFLESGWGTGVFVVAVILNLVLFDRHNIGEWYSICLGAWTMFMVAGMGFHSPLMGTIGLFLLVALVMAGVIVKLRERKRRPDDDR